MDAPGPRKEGRFDGPLADLDLDFGSGSADGDENEERSRKRRVWPWIVLAVILVIVTAVVLGGILLLQALQVRDDLQAAKSKMAQVVPLMKAGDAANVKVLSDEVLKLTTSAEETVNGSLWAIAGAMPWVGANVTAVSETTRATHILVRDALPLASELLPLADPANLTVEGGGISLEPFRTAAPKLPALSAVLDDAKAHIDSIDLNEVHPFIKSNISQIIDIVDDAAPALAFAKKRLPMVVSILGGDGPRSYALLFQNNAEIRATGGNPAAGAVLAVDNGKVTMRDDAAALNFIAAGPSGRYPQHLPMPEEEGLFEGDTWKYAQNYTRMPDFSDTVHLMNGLGKATVGREFDGIISIDPPTLAHMLRVVGPVVIPGERQKVTADNAVRLLLFDTYERLNGDGKLADAYFAQVSSAVFSKVMGGGWDPLKMGEQLQKAAEEQRIYAWFANPQEQEMAAELGIDGKVTSDNKTVTQTGIYLNDASHSKLEFFLSSKIMVACNSQERTMTTSIELHNSIPSAGLNSYTLGARNKNWGYPRTTMFLDVIGMALPGGELASTAPAAGDRSGWDRVGTYNGRQTTSLFITVATDETKKIAFTSTIPADVSKRLQVRYTPTVTTTPVTVDDSCASLFPED